MIRPESHSCIMLIGMKQGRHRAIDEALPLFAFLLVWHTFSFFSSLVNELSRNLAEDDIKENRKVLGLWISCNSVVVFLSSTLPHFRLQAHVSGSVCRKLREVCRNRRVQLTSRIECDVGIDMLRDELCTNCCRGRYSLMRVLDKALVTAFIRAV